MRILYIGSSSDFHIDLWVQYFTDEHDVYLFSEKENYLNVKEFRNVHITYSEGMFGRFLNFLKLKSHKLFQLNKLISTIFYARLIDKIIKEKDIDIVHAHNLYEGFICRYIKSKIPVVFTPMGSDIIIHAQHNFLYKFMAKRAFYRADIITGDSKLIQKKGLLVGSKKQKNYIIQNGVDSKRFFPKRSHIKSSLNIQEDEFLIFSPRGLDEIYNIKTIIDVICLLKKDGAKVKCMISFGFGEDNIKYLKDYITIRGIQENIIWVGSLEYNQMPDYFNAADVIISIPDSDSSPKTVYEAMFCAKPVIVSDLDWVYERLEGKNCILKVDQNNAINIKDVIKSLINNPKLRDELSVNALNLSKKYYDYYDNMKVMEDLMKSEIEENRINGSKKITDTDNIYPMW